MKKRTKIIIIVTLAIILISGITVAASKMWWGDSSDTAQADTVTSDSRGESKEDATESDKPEIKAEYIDQDKTEIDTLKAINEASAKSVDSDKTKEESNPKTTDNMKTENGQSNKADNSTKESPAEKKTDSAFRSEGNCTEAATQQKAEVTTETRNEAKTEKQTQATTQTKVEPTTQKKTEAPTQAPTEVPKCSHNWVWKTHTETVHHDAVTHEETYLIGDAWDEPVYVTKVKCFVCGTYYASDADYQANDNCMGSYGHENVVDHFIHHDAEYGTDIIVDTPAYDEYVEVKDYQYCSKCGERK